MFKSMGKEINAILGAQTILIWTHIASRAISLSRTMVALSTLQTWPQGYKTFFMLSSTKHNISTAHKNYNTDK